MLQCATVIDCNVSLRNLTHRPTALMSVQPGSFWQTLAVFGFLGMVIAPSQAADEASPKLSQRLFYNPIRSRASQANSHLAGLRYFRFPAAEAREGRGEMLPSARSPRRSDDDAILMPKLSAGLFRRPQGLPPKMPSPTPALRFSRLSPSLHPPRDRQDSHQTAGMSLPGLSFVRTGVHQRRQPVSNRVSSRRISPKATHFSSRDSSPDQADQPVLSQGPVLSAPQLQDSQADPEGPTLSPSVKPHSAWLLRFSPLKRIRNLWYSTSS